MSLASVLMISGDEVVARHDWRSAKQRELGDITPALTYGLYCKLRTNLKLSALEWAELLTEGDKCQKKKGS